MTTEALGSPEVERNGHRPAPAETVGDRPVVVARARRAPADVAAVLVGGGGTVVALVVGARAGTAHGLNALDVVVMALVVLWSLVAVVELAWGSAGLARMVAVGTVAAAAAWAAGRLGHPVGGGPHRVDEVVRSLALPLAVAASVHLGLALPEGSLAQRWRRGLALTVYAAAGVAGVIPALSGHPLGGRALALVWVVAVAASIPALRWRYRSAVGPVRDRLQWIGVGVVLAADAAVLVAVLHQLVRWPAPVGAVALAASAFLPLGLMAAVSRPLAATAGRALVWVLSAVGLTLTVAAMYLVFVLGLGLTPSTDPGRQLLGLSMLAAAASAVAFLSSRDRLHGWAVRYVHGAREAPDEVLRTFGSRLTRAIAMDELLLQLAESLRKTMSLSSAQVYTGSGEVLERTVSVPDVGQHSLVLNARERPVITRAGVSGNAWVSVWLPALLDARTDTHLRVAPISHAGELLGLIVVDRPVLADAFSEEDDRVITELARQVGLALHNAQLDTELQTTNDKLRLQAAELRESRARVVAAGDAERRKVERNLHDGAQQHLVALAVNLRLAREIIADDPAAGDELLDQLAGEVQDTIKELRELAHGIFPPLLVDGGLVEALQAAANRSPLTVDLVADGIERYSPEIETAVYFCCLEALQNAGKHAPEASVILTLGQQSSGLVFSVRDDGPGFDPEVARGGHGYINMSDRMGAIGGSVRWDSAPGSGSEIRGTVPLV